MKVLPEPVTPINTWCFFACAQPFGEGLDGLRLIAGRFKRGNELEGGLGKAWNRGSVF